MSGLSSNGRDDGRGGVHVDAELAPDDVRGGLLVPLQAGGHCAIVIEDVHDASLSPRAPPDMAPVVLPFPAGVDAGPRPHGSPWPAHARPLHGSGIDESGDWIVPPRSDHSRWTRCGAELLRVVFRAEGPRGCAECTLAPPVAVASAMRTRCASASTSTPPAMHAPPQPDTGAAGSCACLRLRATLDPTAPGRQTPEPDWPNEIVVPPRRLAAQLSSPRSVRHSVPGLHGDAEHAAQGGRATFVVRVPRGRELPVDCHVCVEQAATGTMLVRIAPSIVVRNDGYRGHASMLVAATDGGDAAGTAPSGSRRGRAAGGTVLPWSAVARSAHSAASLASDAPRVRLAIQPDERGSRLSEPGAIQWSEPFAIAAHGRGHFAVHIGTTHSFVVRRVCDAVRGWRQ